MKQIRSFVQAHADRARELSGAWGRRVDIDEAGVLSREGFLPLDRPGRWSANHSCQMLRAPDGWIAVNLSREDDKELVPAWIQATGSGNVWDDIKAYTEKTPVQEVVARARLLGLPVSRVGEVVSDLSRSILIPLTPRHSLPRAVPLRVVDMSSLWAGPLCGSFFAHMGAIVKKVESPKRPDGSRSIAPFYQKLNAGKLDCVVDFATGTGRDWLEQEVRNADVLITSARPRALEALGLSPRLVFAGNPRLVWVAITGYGFRGAGAAWVAFGDDAAAAGGLVGRCLDGSPTFLGDAVADPLTGVRAFVAALEALAKGGGYIVDAALAPTAAAAAETKCISERRHG